MFHYSLVNDIYTSFLFYRIVGLGRNITWYWSITFPPTTTDDYTLARRSHEKVAYHNLPIFHQSIFIEFNRNKRHSQYQHNPYIHQNIDKSPHCHRFLYLCKRESMHTNQAKTKTDEGTASSLMFPICRNAFPKLRRYLSKFSICVIKMLTSIPWSYHINLS